MHADSEAGAAMRRGVAPGPVGGADFASADKSDATAEREHQPGHGMRPAAAGHWHSAAAGALEIARSEGSALGALLLGALAIVALVTAQATAILLTLSKETMSQFSVDRDTCGGCSCWDGLSKAPYDKGRFKFIFFNMEPQTVFIFAVVVFFVLMLDRALRALAGAVRAGRADWAAVAAFAVAMPGVMYGAGMMYHYINDEFYAMMPTQLFFTVTETVTAACIVRLAVLPGPSTASAAAREAAARTLCLWVVWSVALSHVVLAGLDQGFLDLSTRAEDVTLHAFARALVFMSSDTLLLLWSSWQLGLVRCFGRPQRAWPGWSALSHWLAGTAAVCAWYRLVLPLV